MKKILILAIALVAMISQAASIDWTVNFGITSRSLRDTNGNAMTGTAYLILASDVTDIDNSVSEDISTFLAEVGSKQIGTYSISNGRFNKDGSSTEVRATSGRLVADQSYDFQFLIYDSLNKLYYTTGSKTQSAYATPSSEVEGASYPTITFTADQIGTAKAGTPSSSNFKSAVIVPEPATGALALAGLALLFRRKRA